MSETGKKLARNDPEPKYIEIARRDERERLAEKFMAAALGGFDTYEDQAKHAFQVADAFIAEREQQRSKAL